MFISMAAMIVMAGIAAPMWNALAKRWGKRNAWLFWSFFTAISDVLFCIHRQRGRDCVHWHCRHQRDAATVNTTLGHVFGRRQTKHGGKAKCYAGNCSSKLSVCGKPARRTGDSASANALRTGWELQEAHWQLKSRASAATFVEF